MFGNARWSLAASIGSTPIFSNSIRLIWVFVQVPGLLSFQSSSCRRVSRDGFSAVARARVNGRYHDRNSNVRPRSIAIIAAQPSCCHCQEVEPSLWWNLYISLDLKYGLMHSPAHVG